MKKSLQAVATIAAVAILVSLAAGCAPAKKKAVLVGVAKFVTHPALDALEKGVQDELTAEKPDVTFDLQNANADMGTAAQIAQKFRTEKADLVIGIATPTAQALANAEKKGPVVFCAVTDPVGSGLTANLDGSGTNVTGSSDMTPVKEQLELLFSLKPGFRKLGHVYNPGEANSAMLARTVQAVCADKGVEFVGATVASSSEVKQATLSIAGRVDGIYLSNDNTVFSAISAVTEVCLAKKLPLVTADPSSAETMPVLAATGFDYYRMGRATGKIAARILSGEKPGSIPVYFAHDPAEMSFVLNLDVAKKIGITVPDSVKQAATVVIENGTTTRK